MVTEDIVLGHKISVAGLEVDQAKVSIIENLLPPTIVKGIRSFLGHAGFYRRFIKTSQKYQGHYVDCWKKKQSLKLRKNVSVLLKKSRTDLSELLSWQHQTGTKNLRSSVMPVILPWELCWDKELTRPSDPYIIVTPRSRGVSLTTRQPAEYLCLIPRDPYMSKNGHIGLHIILIKYIQLYCNSSRVDTSLLIQTYIKI